MPNTGLSDSLHTRHDLPRKVRQHFGHYIDMLELRDEGGAGNRAHTNLKNVLRAALGPHELFRMNRGAEGETANEPSSGETIHHVTLADRMDHDLDDALGDLHVRLPRASVQALMRVTQASATQGDPTIPTSDHYLVHASLIVHAALLECARDIVFEDLESSLFGGDRGSGARGVTLASALSAFKGPPLSRQETCREAWDILYQHDLTTLLAHHIYNFATLDEVLRPVATLRDMLTTTLPEPDDRGGGNGFVYHPPVHGPHEKGIGETLAEFRPHSPSVRQMVGERDPAFRSHGGATIGGLGALGTRPYAESRRGVGIAPLYAGSGDEFGIDAILEGHLLATVNSARSMVPGSYTVMDALRAAMDYDDDELRGQLADAVRHTRFRRSVLSSPNVSIDHPVLFVTCLEARAEGAHPAAHGEAHTELLRAVVMATKEILPDIALAIPSLPRGHLPLPFAAGDRYADLLGESEANLDILEALARECEVPLVPLAGSQPISVSGFQKALSHAGVDHIRPSEINFVDHCHHYSAMNALSLGADTPR